MTSFHRKETTFTEDFDNQQWADEDFKLNVAVPQKHQDAIKDLISEYEYSKERLEELVPLCIQFIADAERGIDSVNENRGFFKRIWGAITGSTENTNLQTSQDLASAQKACVQIINELAKQGAIQQQQIIALENLVRYQIKSGGEFRNMLVKNLESIFANIKKRFEHVERVVSRVTRNLYTLKETVDYHAEVLEQVKEELQAHDNELVYLKNMDQYLLDLIRKLDLRVDTLEWEQTLKSYNNPYQNMSDMDKISKATKDFYVKKNGEFTYTDLQIFSNGLESLGFDTHKKLTIREYLEHFIEECKNNDRLAGYIHTRLYFSNNKDEVFPKKHNADLFDPKSKVIRALNIITFTEDFGNDVGQSIAKSAIDKLHKWNVDVDKELDWFQFAVELLNHLGNVDKERRLDDEQRKWKPIVNFAKGNLDLRNVDRFLIQNILEPVLSKIRYQYSVVRIKELKENNHLHLINLLQKEEFDSIVQKEGSNSLIWSLHPRGDSAGMYLWGKITFKENKLCLKTEISVLNDSDLHEFHLGLTNLTEYGFSPSEDDGDQYITYMKEIMLSEDQIINSPEALYDSISTVIDSALLVI
mgnify:CR=1 FL=1